MIYFAGAHALEPRVDSQTGRPFDVEVAPFQTAEPGAAESLRRVLERDRFPDDGRLSRHAHVYRLGVRAGDAGPRALAVRLTGFPDQAFARVEGPGDGAARLRLCGAFSGSEPLLAGGVTSAALSGEAFDNHLVFPYGWHGVELDGRTRFRWMAAREAELVVEVARTGQIRLQIDARHVAESTAGDPTVSLRVNDLELPAQPMQPGYRVYSWVVPARAWTVGVNRVTLGVSQLLVPAEAGPSSDTRPLGAAVRMVRLELIGAE